MPSANPRGLDQWTPRVQEFMGGHRPREMVGDYDVNPNENSDGLSHHSQQGTSTEEFRTQIDPKKRREKALKDMNGEIPHISVKPEEIEETLSRSPMTDEEGTLNESAMGVDMGHASDGIGISAGAHTGPVRREGPGLLFGRSKEEAFEDVWSLMKDDEDDLTASQIQQQEYDDYTEDKMGGGIGRPHYLQAFDDVTQQIEPISWAGMGIDRLRDRAKSRSKGTPPTLTDTGFEEVEEQIRQNLGHDDRGLIDLQDAAWFMPNPEKHSEFKDLIAHSKEGAPPVKHYVPPHGEGTFTAKEGDMEEWQDKNASEEGPTFISDILKAKKRKKRGRKYEEDEESDEDERTSKKKRKREKKREMKRGKNRRGSRDIKGMTARRAAAAEQNVDRGTKRQAFSQRRMMGGNPRSKDVPLRIRDPVAYQRKLANERMARQQGALPRDMTHHRDTRGIKGKVQTIGMDGKGTKLPSQPSSSKGTKFKKPKSAEREGSLIHDPLGGDPLKMLLAKAATMESRARSSKISQAELHSIKRELKKLITAVERLSKSGPELGEEAKRGNQASEEKNSAPTGGTKNLKGWEFDDTSLMLVAGAAGAGKR